MDTKKLRQKILDLAIHGKLVPQDPNDEPASVLLERISNEKERLIKEGKIKRSKQTASSELSPDDVPFELPEGWCWCVLSDIAQSNIGLTYNPKDISPAGIPVMRSNNIQGRQICLNDVVRVKTTVLETQYLNVGDLLICARNGSRRLVGKCAIIKNLEEPTSFGAFMAVCRSKYNQWINIVLNTAYFTRYLDDSNSTTIYQVTQKMLLELKIPLPPLAEQKRIVSAVEQWMSVIDVLENNEEDLRQSIDKAKSKILDLAIRGKLVHQDSNDEPASDLLKRLGISTDNCPCEDLPFELPNGWCWTTLGNISNYGSCSTADINSLADDTWILELEDIEKDSAKILQKLTKSQRDIKGVRHKFNKGNVLYSKLRTYLNKVLVAPDDGFCTTEIIPIITTEVIISEYLTHVLRSKYFLDYTTQCGYGVKMPRLSTTDAKKAFIPLPPLAEQHRIVAKIEQLYSQLDEIESSLQS